jgi:hypothetical protein
MTMREGERWVCSNPECRCEIYVVIAAGPGDGTNPKCTCGFRMRKAYTSPGFRRIHHLDELKAVQEKFSSRIL